MFSGMCCCSSLAGAGDAFLITPELIKATVRDGSQRNGPSAPNTAQKKERKTKKKEEDETLPSVITMQRHLMQN